MTGTFRSPLETISRSITGWRGLLLVLGLALAWHALRGVAWTEAWGLLAGIGPGALLVLLALNLGMLPLMTGRWWLLLRTLGLPVGLRSLCAYRCGANAVSYLTPGPHFGGEPLLVFLLHRRRGIPLAGATTSVVLDRLLELFASIAVLSVSLIVMAAPGNRLFTGGWALPLALLLLIILAAFLAALLSGRRPLSRLVARLHQLVRRWIAPASPTAGRLLQAIVAGEAMAESLLAAHRCPFLLANLFSLGFWLGAFIEVWLMSAFMGHLLSFWQLTAIITTARLAFLTPLPAGLGVLESALPWLTATLGLGSTLGLSLCLLIRCRDILFNVAGLGLVMKYLTCPDKALNFTRRAR